MGKIKVLSQEVADIIAAGEVVENPSSLVKELIENSLDANSKSIVVEISNNSRNIKVYDDGEGMSEDDLKICTKRHATSKISSKDDLYNLHTYGFRGEALSSISSVSKLAISTKQENANGNRLIQIGEESEMEPIAKNRGTDIFVEDLFFNVPARLKFLRSAENEYTKIKNIVLKEALANYNVSFSLIIEDKEKLRTSGSGIENTILELFNGNVLKSLNKFEWGYLGDINLGKSSKDFIFTYFNGRYAKSYMVDKAIVDAYYTRLPKGKYPFVILMMEPDPKTIDVNVHPSKKIIKFANEPTVYKVVRNKVSEALSTIDRKIISSAIDSQHLKKPSDFSPTFKSSFDFAVDVPQNNNLYEVKKSIKMEEKKIEDTRQDDYFVENRFVGQINRTFSVVECKDRVELYDNHIVQERVLYEQIKESYANKNIKSQALLVPLQFDLTTIEKESALKNTEFFQILGFEVEDFGGKNIVVRSVPTFNFHDSLQNIFQDIVEKVSENKKEDIGDIREEVIIMMSCRKSIKAGDRVTEEEMKKLINELHRRGSYTCPHGRNIIVDISFDYLEKKFQRKK